MVLVLLGDVGRVERWYCLLERIGMSGEEYMGSIGLEEDVFDVGVGYD